MKALGLLVLEEIVLDPHPDHILYAPHGWLEDSSFPKAAKELDVTLVSAGSWSPDEHDRVEAKLEEAPRGPSKSRVVLVETQADAHTWSSKLDGQWKVMTRQAIDVFPTLDPDLTCHLDVSQVNQLLSSYGNEVVSERAGIRGSKPTARILLRELYGIDADRLETVEGLLETALRLHLRDASVHPTWVDALADELPSLDQVDVESEQILTDLDALVTAVGSLVEGGDLVGERWATAVDELLAMGAQPSGSIQDAASLQDRWMNLDPEHVAEEVLEVDWDALALSSWPDQADLLSRLVLASVVEESGETGEAREVTDRAFEHALEDYAHLLNSPWSRRPPMVHTIPNYLAGKHSEDERVALLVIDCLSLPLWHILRDVLSADHGLDPSWEATTFAWIPTVTSVTRQAMLSGKKPIELGDQLRSTYGEDSAWRSFWSDHGIPEYASRFVKTVEKSERRARAQEGLRNPDVQRMALIANQVDKLFHATASSGLSFEGLVHELVQNWIPDTFAPLMEELQEEGWTTYVTSDHGAHQMKTKMSNPREGVLVKTRGQRVRIYSNEVFAQNPEIEGTRWDDKDTLPEDMVAVLAPSGKGYGKTGWGHGGAAWDEVLVPFVRYGGQT